MLLETILQITLVTATLLCSLVTGFILLFVIVVMPGLGTLDNRDFLRAFQVTDRVIQDSQPLFVLIWVGSAVALIAGAALGIWQLAGIERLLIILATLLYLLGTQLPTVAVNIPLNNRLQRLELDTLAADVLAQERQQFEPRWNRWNTIRTIFATLASILLLTLLAIL